MVIVIVIVVVVIFTILDKDEKSATGAALFNPNILTLTH